uniref:Uncharacterized protein n=1 Tax=Anguilla anguilla TaxID=7936 RepID=A0A0E9QAL5_ANGAN
MDCLPLCSTKVLGMSARGGDLLKGIHCSAGVSKHFEIIVNQVNNRRGEEDKMARCDGKFQSWGSCPCKCVCSTWARLLLYPVARGGRGAVS